MTTLPHRVDNVLPITLKSLETQTMRPKSVEINMPHVRKDGTPYTVPAWLQRMHDGGAVRIYRVDDVGPATKYLPTLERYATSPDQKILVVDDDMILDSRRVEEFDAASEKYPDAVIAAHIMSVNKADCKFSLDTFENSTPNVMTNVAAVTSSVGVGAPGDIVAGFQNYLIKPKFVDTKELGDYDSMPPEAFYVDDVVISGHLGRRGVNRIVPPGMITGLNKLPSKHFWKHVLALATISNPENLSTSANRTSHNNDTMVKYFRDVWCR